MKGCVSIVVISIHIDLILKQHLGDFKVAAQCGDQQAIAIELGHRIHICLVFAQQLNYIVVTLVAGIVKRGPVVEPSMIDEGGIVVLAMSEEFFGLVVLPVFAVLPELFVVLGNLYPKFVPVDLEVLDICMSQ